MLNEFVQSLKRTGVHKPNRYAMQIEFPPRVVNNVMRETNINLRDESDMFMRIERVNIPADNIKLEEQYSQSRNTRHIASDRENPEHLSFSIILSENLRERQIFEIWNEFIYGKDDLSYQPKFLDSYVGPTATVYIINETEGSLLSAIDNAELKYVYKNVFPVTLSEVELSYSETDAYSTTTVTMAYSSWDRVLS